MPRTTATTGLPPRVLKASAAVLHAMAHPARLKIVERLIGREQRVGQLVDLLKLKQHAVSRHLRELRAAGIVAARRDGRHVYYRLVNADAAAVVKAIHRSYFHAANFRDGEAI